MRTPRPLAEAVHSVAQLNTHRGGAYPGGHDHPRPTVTDRAWANTPSVLDRHSEGPLAVSRHRAGGDGDAELAPGVQFAAYEVLQRLGAGGMGEIYLCRHRMLDRVDAVKVLHRYYASDPIYRQRLRLEALSAAKLRHPNIVTIYTADEADGLLYLAMEYVEGADLADVIEREGTLDLARTAALLGPVAAALDAAHDKRIIHRDVKPSNVLVAADERPFITDFGISKWVGVTDEALTATGEFVGTVAYCAPEQLTGEVLDGRCDQYALACVAYECLTGQPPYLRDSQVATMAAHLTLPPPRIRDLRPDLPPAADALFARALAKVPARRFVTCAAFIAALAVLVDEPAGPDADEATAFMPPRRLSRPKTPQPPATGTGSMIGVPLLRSSVVTPPPILAVIGGPGSGAVVRVPEGGLHLHGGGSHGARIELVAGGLRLAPFGPGRVNGLPAEEGCELRPGDLISVHATLVQVRSAAEPWRDPFGDPDVGWVGLDPLAVTHLARTGLPEHGTVGKDNELMVRVGWRHGTPPGPVAVKVGGVDPLAVRGAPEAAAGLLRRVITQLAVLYAPGDLAIVAALAPLGDEDWGWLGELPHARALPLVAREGGTANGRRHAKLLGAALRSLVDTRQRSARSRPRVVALIDDRLGGIPRGLVGPASAQVGVHPVVVLAPNTKVPTGVGMHLELDPRGAGMGLHLGRHGIPAQTGVPDGVTSEYARSIAATIAAR
jgi:serine/threonine protein kinase